MTNKKFLLLENNYMAFHTLQDVEELETVSIFHRKKVSNNKIINLLFNIHNSGKIEKYVTLPFRSIWDNILYLQLLGILNILLNTFAVIAQKVN